MPALPVSCSDHPRVQRASNSCGGDAMGRWLAINCGGDAMGRWLAINCGGVAMRRWLAINCAGDVMRRWLVLIVPASRRIWNRLAEEEERNRDQIAGRC